MKKNKAFTLAETLITLSILGVVAALIIPSIINNWQKRVTITKLQRAYSYIMNNIQETLVVNGCETIGCVLEKHNLYVNTNNLDKSFEQLKIFFPDITKDTQNKCVSSKSPYYDLNHSNANTGNNINVYAGDSYSYKYCLKNNIGLAARPISVPAGNETSITFNCNKHEKNNIYSRCLAFTIFTGRPNQEVVFGKNAFILYINPKGDLATYHPNKGCKDDYTDEYKAQISYGEGFGCLPRIIKNGWKIDY